MPRCIIVNRRERAVLNAVSLSCPGLNFLIESGKWQAFTEPFFISVMSPCPTLAGRTAECDALFSRLAAAKKYERFHADWGVQVNLSCPNIGLDPSALVEEALPLLDLAEKRLPENVPVMLKFGPEAHPESMLPVARHPRCDALCVFNTLPFGRHPAWAREAPPIDWKKLFGTDSPQESPMAKRFPECPGGYSGPGLLPMLLEWLKRVRALGVQIPICAGGGIYGPADVGHVFDAGADAVFLGTIAMHAPTKVAATIREAQRYARQRKCAPILARCPLEYNV
jgi:dihydroorotate dehydrogenase